jgi:hypothetical protein
MTIYNKEMKKTIRGVEDTYSYTKRKQRRLYALGRGLQRENRRKRSKKLRRGEETWGKKSKDKENAEGKRLMEWIEEKWMGSIEWRQIRGRRRGMDLYR